MEKVIAVIDLKAFYASVECVERNLDPFITPLVVCDTTRGMGTIVLSVTPYLKKKGVPSRCRRRDLPYIPNLIFATPQMSHYIQKSCQITSILLDFVAEEDLHIYSIDECFLNLGPYLKMYNKSPEEIVSEIQKRIYDETKITATAGISYNPFMAKVALDLEGKNKAPKYQATWTEKDIKEKLWKVKPLSELWGISSGYEKRLNRIGVFDVGQLANCDIAILRDNFGVMGDQLHDLANGIDESNIQEKYVSETTSFSTGEALYRDFTYKEVRTLIREHNDNLCARMHKQNLQTSVIGLAIMYSKACETVGFSHQMKLIQPCDNNNDIYSDLMQIYDKYIEDLPIRRIYISFGNLSFRGYQQMSLFEDNDVKENQRNEQLIIEQVQEKFGKTKLSRATALLDESTYIQRSNQIGGHRK